LSHLRVAGALGRLYSSTWKGVNDAGTRSWPMYGSAQPVNDYPGTSSDTGLWRHDPERGSGGIAPLGSPARGIPPHLSVAHSTCWSEDGRGCLWHNPSGTQGRLAAGEICGSRVALVFLLSSGTSIPPIIEHSILILYQNVRAPRITKTDDEPACGFILKYCGFERQYMPMESGLKSAMFSGRTIDVLGLLQVA
jgi:hypothetical protein